MIPYDNNEHRYTPIFGSLMDIVYAYSWTKKDPSNGITDL